MTELNGVQVIVLRPEDKVVASFDTNVVDIKGAQIIYKHLSEFFEGRPVIGIYGTELKFIREEFDNDAKDNFRERLAALQKDM